MRHGRFSTSRSSTLHRGRYRVRGSYWCAQRVHAALRGFPYEKAALHRRSWLATQQFMCRTIHAMLPQLLQWTAEATLSNASAWRMLVNDSSLVAWFHTRNQCAAATLSALIEQREQLPECYARL